MNFEQNVIAVTSRLYFATSYCSSSVSGFTFNPCILMTLALIPTSYYMDNAYINTIYIYIYIFAKSHSLRKKSRICVST